MALTNEEVEEAFKNAMRDKMGGTIPVGPPGSGIREPDDEYAYRSRQVAEYYESLAAKDTDRSDLLPPVRDDRNPFVDVANIVLHDEMAAVGMALDQNNFDWNLQSAKEGWT